MGNNRLVDMGVKFLVISSGFNCSTLLKKCYESILAQSYKNFDAIIIDDGSDQATKDALINLKNSDKRIEIFLCPRNRGAAYRRWYAINGLSKKKFNEETVIVLLGLDDELLPGALERVNEEYKKGAWMTYGNWKGQDGYMLKKGFLDFPFHIIANRDFRKDVYRSTALNTFKKFLFDKIPVNDFKINGRWIDSTTESEVMFSCLEMCGRDRIGVIYDPIYLYNRNLPGGTLKRLGREYKYLIYDQIIKRPKKPLLIR